MNRFLVIPRCQISFYSCLLVNIFILGVIECAFLHLWTCIISLIRKYVIISQVISSKIVRNFVFI